VPFIIHNGFRTTATKGGIPTLFLIIGTTAFLISACTTAEEIKRPSGKTQYIIGCGAAVGWNVCYSRANELCPEGYMDVSKNAGFSRKELIIECHR
jgi:hypothetical protein